MINLKVAIDGIDILVVSVGLVVIRRWVGCCEIDLVKLVLVCASFYVPNITICVGTYHINYENSYSVTNSYVFSNPICITLVSKETQLVE